MNEILINIFDFARRDINSFCITIVILAFITGVLSSLVNLLIRVHGDRIDKNKKTLEKENNNNE